MPEQPIERAASAHRAPDRTGAPVQGSAARWRSRVAATLAARLRRLAERLAPAAVPGSSTAGLGPASATGSEGQEPWAPADVPPASPGDARARWLEHTARVPAHQWMSADVHGHGASLPTPALAALDATVVDVHPLTIGADGGACFEAPKRPPKDVQASGSGRGHPDPAVTDRRRSALAGHALPTRQADRAASPGPKGLAITPLTGTPPRQRDHPDTAAGLPAQLMHRTAVAAVLQPDGAAAQPSRASAPGQVSQDPFGTPGRAPCAVPPDRSRDDPQPPRILRQSTEASPPPAAQRPAAHAPALAPAAPKTGWTEAPGGWAHPAPHPTPRADPRSGEAFSATAERRRRERPPESSPIEPDRAARRIAPAWPSLPPTFAHRTDTALVAGPAFIGDGAVRASPDPAQQDRARRDAERHGDPLPGLAGWVPARAGGL